MGSLQKKASYSKSSQNNSFLRFCWLFLDFSGVGWRAAVQPADHPVANFEFDVVVGADGRRNTLEGEKAGRFRGVCRGLEEAAIVWSFVTDKQHIFHDSASLGPESVFVNLISPPGELLVSNT